MQWSTQFERGQDEQIYGVLRHRGRRWHVHDPDRRGRRLGWLAVKRWTAEEEAELARVWGEEEGSVSRVSQRLGLTRGQVIGKSARLNLHYGVEIQRRVAPPDQRGSMHPQAVRDPTPDVELFKKGRDNRKIGWRIEKGPWRGLPIYTLTLEERATCPRTCSHWASCYGNNMGLARRWRHGPALEERIDQELEMLSKRHPEGFAVRLHILGDFYSVGYVDAWRYWLLSYPKMRVWGYTAWSPSSSVIGKLLSDMAELYWDRFAVRHSNAGLGERGTTTLYQQGVRGRVAEGVVCPVESGDTRSCATCGLCWADPKTNIVFLAH
jgi:hypothetical protein